MKYILKIVLLIALLFDANLLHAQLQFSGPDLSAIESTTPLATNELPSTGTYYSAANPQWPPLPGDISGLSAWDLGGGVYLLDDLDGLHGGGSFAMDDSEPLSPGGGNDGGNYNGFPNNSSFSFPTNGLWLWITNVADNTVYANLNGATDYVYEIFSTTNLAAVPAVSSWNIETEVLPGMNTNTMPFTVPMAGRNDLFLWARDWTGITSPGNQTPEWWFYCYFGSIGLSDTNLDNQGNTLLYDYQNGIDPNVIQSSISVTNQYVNSLVPIQINVTAGEPFYFSTLIDNTNFASAAWCPYTSSNITVNLGSAPGWHNVWVGLRGLPEIATQTWLWTHVFVASPPLLVITNPTTSTVDVPIIQVYGFCQETLASISYDLSNSAGVLANQPSEITDQFFDTNAFGITTNYFECLDVPLTNGLNTITLHATDLAGNITTTNFNFTVDYSSKTNPPVVQITWPQDGTQISGTNFTCVGSISDPTATVIGSIPYTNTLLGGFYTNTYTAEVSRNGSFSLENLPLNTGTNSLTITVTDVAGNTTVTNVNIVQTNFVLTINPVSPDSQLWQPTANLTGTISDSTYAVWVNGVKGTNNGDGTWSASNVPVNNANFAATAYAPNEQQPDGSYGN